MSGPVGFGLAFVAGLVSFLSPCVLPLIPAYVSFMTGVTVAELEEAERPSARLLLPALLFVAGFSIVFVALGATASVLGTFLAAYRVLIERVAGVVIVLFGVLMLGVIKVPWLYGEARVDLAKTRVFGRGAALVMGMAFATGWTPCVGPILGSILALAGSSRSVGYGALLLLVYSAGLGVPFVAVTLLFGRTRPLIRWLGRHSLAVNRSAGAVLILVGVLVLSGRLTVLTAWLAKIVPSLGL